MASGKNQKTDLALNGGGPFLAEILDLLPLAVFRLDCEGRFMVCNDACLDLFNADSKADLTSKSIVGFCFNNDLHQKFHKLLQSGSEVENLELPVKVNGGKNIWLWLWLKRISEGKDEGSNWIGCAADISERKQIELSLSQRDEFGRTVIENSPVGVSVRDPKGRLLAYNRAWQQLWGIKGDRLLEDLQRERTQLEFDQRDRYLGDWMPAVQAVYNHGGYLHIPDIKLPESTRRETRWISQHFFSIENGSGAVDRVVILTEDITHRKQAKEELLKSEMKYRTLQANIPVGIFRSTPRGKILSVNPALAKMYGFNNPEEYLNIPAEQMYDDPQLRHDLLQELKAKGSIHDLEGLMRRKDGSTFWISMSVQATFDNQGNIIYFDGIEQDISKRKQAEQQLAAVNREKYEQAKRIAGVFAHEIRNALFPAAAALNRLNTKYVEDPKDVHSVDKFLAIAQRAISSAAETTKLISDLTRLDNEIMPKRVNLAGVIREAIKNNHLAVEEQGITVSTRGDEQIHITSNRGQLLLALGNLMLNSIQALLKKKKPAITISWEDKNGSIQLAFKDNGCGIPPENLGQIFELFFTTHPSAEGCGIGLATTRKVLEIYGGSISASSRLGKWTRFDLQFKKAD